MRWAGHAARMGKWRGSYRVLVGSLRERDHLEGSRWENNVKMCLQVVGCGRMDWIELAPDWQRWRTAGTVNAVMNREVHKMRGIY